MDLLRPEATSRQGASERDVQRDVASWVWAFAAGGIGPGGGLKLMDGEMVSAAAALRMADGDPALAPYQDLAVRMGALGDQGHLSVLLAAGTVGAVLEGRGLAQRIEGVRLARRQLLAWLEAHAESATARAALSGVDARLDPLVARLDGVDLDLVDVRPGPVEVPSWSRGLVLPDSGLRSREVSGKVLLVDDLLPAARQAPSVRLGGAAALDAVRGAPARDRARLRKVVQESGIRIVLCRSDPGEAAADLAQDGVYVVGHVEQSMAQRAAMATGSTAAPHAFAFSPGDLGQGEMVRHQRLREVDWRLTGTGGACTIEVPRGPMEASRVAAVEKWLRAAAPIADDPRVLPGGGAWQRDAATAIRAVADHAPGAAPLGMRAVAQVLDRIADAIIRNTGRDPLRQRVLEPIHDPMACIRPAVAGALETAIQVLRIDGRHSRRASRPADLRGGLGPAGSPKGMPGDIPPLM